MCQADCKEHVNYLRLLSPTLEAGSPTAWGQNEVKLPYLLKSMVSFKVQWQSKKKTKQLGLDGSKLAKLGKKGQKNCPTFNAGECSKKCHVSNNNYSFQGRKIYKFRYFFNILNTLYLLYFLAIYASSTNVFVLD